MVASHWNLFDIFDQLVIDKIYRRDELWLWMSCSECETKQKKN